MIKIKTNAQIERKMETMPKLTNKGRNLMIFQKKNMKIKIKIRVELEEASR